MKPAVKFPIILLLVVACALMVVRCHRLLRSEGEPELSMYVGLGAGAAEEIQRLVPGEGRWLVVALEPSSLPRYGALVDGFKRDAKGETTWHFLPEESSLSFQSDGLGAGALREIMRKYPGINGVVLLGGAFNADGTARDPAGPPVVAGPMSRETALPALAKGQLAAAIVYREASKYVPDASPAKQFSALFEILHEASAP